MQDHWPHWVRVNMGPVPPYATVDYAARKAINALRGDHTSARLTDLGDGDLWLIVADGDFAFDCYPAHGGEKVRFMRIGDRMAVCGRSTGGSRCAIKPLRAAILKQVKEFNHA